MMFGDRTDEAEPRSASSTRRSTPGVNFIDTADAYVRASPSASSAGDRARDRAHWVLATKVGQPPPAPARTTAACRGAAARAPATPAWAAGHRLHRRLLPAPRRPQTPMAETVGAIGDLIRAGKIRYFGVSNFRGWRIAEIVDECRAQGVRRRSSASPITTCSTGSPRSRCCPPASTTASAWRPTPARARHADRQVPRRRAAGRRTRAPRARTRGSWRPSSAPSRSRSPQTLAPTREEDGAHAAAVRARVAVDQPHRDVVIAGPRTLEQWQDYLSRARHRWSTPRTRRWSTRWCLRATRRRPATPMRHTRWPGGWRAPPDGLIKVVIPRPSGAIGKLFLCTRRYG